MHIFHALFTHAQGGLGQSHANTTQALVYKGHAVTALMHGESPYCHEVASHGAMVQTLEPRGFYDIATAWKARRLMTRLRPDLVIAHNARAIALLTFAATGTGIPVIGVSHSYKTARTTRADVLVVLSEHMRQHFLKAGYKKRVEAIPNLIHLPSKPTPYTRHTPLVIGAIGRFTGEKGFADLIEALHELKLRGVDFRARIGGDGPELENLREQAATLGILPQIVFEGWVADKAAFYRQLDMLCLPSREESFPLVVLEALAYGVPMVATDAPGPASMLIDGVDGLIVPRGDTKTMAQALQKLAAQPELAARMAEEGWRSVQRYSFPSVATQWDGVLKSIISPATMRQAA